MNWKVKKKINARKNCSFTTPDMTIIIRACYKCLTATQIFSDSVGRQFNIY